MKKRLVPFFILLFLSGCANNVDLQELQVNTAVVQHSEIAATIEIAGVLSPYNTTHVTSKLSGIIVAVNNAAGEYVNDGDILAALDTKDLDMQLKQAIAAYNVVKDQVVLSKSNLDSAKVSEEATKSALEATKSLINDQVALAKSKMDAAQKALNAAIKQNSVQLEQATISLESVQKNYDRELQIASWI